LPDITKKKRQLLKTFLFCRARFLSPRIISPEHPAIFRQTLLVALRTMGLRQIGSGVTCLIAGVKKRIVYDAASRMQPSSASFSARPDGNRHYFTISVCA
jgi:hypothetical protein